MAAEDLVRMVPILTGRELAPMVAFYERLGLRVALDHGDYVILTSAPDDDGATGVELHLTVWEDHDPRTTAGSVYLLVRDARALWQELHDALAAEGTLYRAPASGLTSELVADLRAREDAGEALTRLHDVEDKPWGLCEFGVIDPAGTLVRVASILR